MIPSGRERSSVGDGDLVTTGQAWNNVIGALRAAERLVPEDATPDERAEGLRYLTRLFAAGLVTCLEHADPDQPAFGRMVDHTMKWGLDCPDCLYLYTGIGGDRAYRIYGNRGTANHIDIQVNYGHFALGDISQWGTVSSISGDGLETEADGRFELFLGGEARETNWLPLAPNAEFVLVRQYFNDWEHERPADLFIERLGATLPAPRPASEQIAARLERLATWMERGGALWERMSQAALDLAPNSLTVYLPQDSDQRAGLRGQAYGIGNFRCQPDEAVLVEFAPPPCRHWSVSLANRYWESLDFATRQTSLNGHQARIDPDGVFRAVIAHDDPGVPNWLDAAGYPGGTIAARFLLADAAPSVAMRAVKLADVPSHLPDETPRIEAAERAQTLERRYRAVLRRYRR
jgi:hypothetical protein